MQQLPVNQAKLLITCAGLQALIAALAGRGYEVLGPAVRHQPATDGQQSAAEAVVARTAGQMGRMRHDSLVLGNGERARE